MNTDTLSKLQKTVERATFLKDYINLIDITLLSLDDESVSISLTLLENEKWPGISISQLFEACSTKKELKRQLREPIFKALVDLRKTLSEEFDKL